MEKRKCLVHGCENNIEQGSLRDICRSCYIMLTTGKIGSGRTFIHLITKITKHDLVDEVMEWSNKGEKGTENKWLNYLVRYLTQMGWDEVAIEDFVDWGEYGFNNEILHATTDLPEFWSEVNYCSDRMSLDRLFRCHVMFRTLEDNKFPRDRKQDEETRYREIARKDYERDLYEECDKEDRESERV